MSAAQLKQTRSSTSYFRSLAFRISFVAGTCYLIICVLLTTLSYQQQKDRVSDELVALESMFHSPLMLELADIETSKTELKKNEEAYKTVPAVMHLQEEMDRAIASDLVENAYLFYPDWIEQDGEPALLNLLSNANLYADEKPAEPYVPVKKLREALVRSEKEGVSSTGVYEDSVGEWISVVSAIKDGHGKLVAYAGIDFSNDFISKTLKKELYRSSLYGLLAALAGIAVMSFTVRLFLRPLHRINEQAEAAAGGDLSGTLDLGVRNEIGMLGQHFNHMIGNLRVLVAQIAETTQRVTSASESLQAGAHTSVQSSRSITGAMEQLSSRSARQYHGTQESSRAMEEMAAGIGRVAESAGTASDASGVARQRAGEGNEQMASSMTQISGVVTTVEQAVEAMERLRVMSDEIGSVTHMISTVTQQTNLLALNASIEAVRAGEHGRGFAVVSGEIRKLAEQSKLSAERISDLIERVQQETRSAVAAIDHGLGEVKAMQQAAVQTGGAFRDLSGSVQQVADQMLDVYSVSEQMSASAQQVSASIAELAELSRQTTELAETISAAAGDQQEAMTQVSRTADELGGISSELQQAVARFKV
ncbi:methyl-accepting chemotaxis protein [Paenibacillus rhizovicinus]|uniref:Methyl-accepting chemotaxis protein n=1 Tax=Paenibacillus rhizovicinus TaxID=2704463 RepID=A0A6C0P732_9BACL|nr:methyl-accepting chemotaxis protein [Paenibacillus rhizovicinus]QHW32392.1 methyl-accepting chemotaxis protein [Paenibacillus rhizovicinus]